MSHMKLSRRSLDNTIPIPMKSCIAISALAGEIIIHFWPENPPNTRCQLLYPNPFLSKLLNVLDANKAIYLLPYVTLSDFHINVFFHFHGVISLFKDAPLYKRWFSNMTLIFQSLLYLRRWLTKTIPSVTKASATIRPGLIPSPKIRAPLMNTPKIGVKKEKAWRRLTG